MTAPYCAQILNETIATADFGLSKAALASQPEQRFPPPPPTNRPAQQGTGCRLAQAASLFPQMNRRSARPRLQASASALFTPLRDKPALLSKAIVTSQRKQPLCSFPQTKRSRLARLSLRGGRRPQRQPRPDTCLIARRMRRDRKRDQCETSAQPTRRRATEDALPSCPETRRPERHPCGFERIAVAAAENGRAATQEQPNRRGACARTNARPEATEARLVTARQQRQRFSGSRKRRPTSVEGCSAGREGAGQLDATSPLRRA